jgi:predicted secreted protein
MADMLAYEAPESGNLRSSLVREFNESFSDTSEDYLVCDPVAVAAESRFAEDGQKIATRLATHYFPKRERTGKGFE